MAKGKLFCWPAAEFHFIILSNYWFYISICGAKNAEIPLGLLDENVSGNGLLKSDVLSIMTRVLCLYLTVLRYATGISS
jgi:hypothetical protein